MSSGVSYIKEMTQRAVNAKENLPALVDGLHNDALKSWGTPQVKFCSLSSQVHKLILHEVYAASKVMEESAHDALKELRGNIQSARLPSKRGSID